MWVEVVATRPLPISTLTWFQVSAISVQIIHYWVCHWQIQYCLILKVKTLHTCNQSPSNTAWIWMPLTKSFLEYFESRVKGFIGRSVFMESHFLWKPMKKADRMLNLKFNEDTFVKFWLSVKKEYTVISKMVIIILLPYSATYMCKMEAATVMKTQETSIKMETTKNGRWKNGICTVWNFSKQ